MEQFVSMSPGSLGCPVAMVVLVGGHQIGLWCRSMLPGGTHQKQSDTVHSSGALAANHTIACTDFRLGIASLALYFRVCKKIARLIYSVHMFDLDTVALRCHCDRFAACQFCAFCFAANTHSCLACFYDSLTLLLRPGEWDLQSKHPSVLFVHVQQVQQLSMVCSPGNIVVPIAQFGFTLLGDNFHLLSTVTGMQLTTWSLYLLVVL